MSSKNISDQRIVLAKQIALLQKKIKNRNNREEQRTGIRWEGKLVNNLPNNNISFNKFSEGDKAIKIDNFRYITPNTFSKLAKMPMRRAFAAQPNKVLFKNPFSRQNVSRKDLKFIFLVRRHKDLQNTV
jgi:hypothetical protein